MKKPVVIGVVVAALMAAYVLFWFFFTGVMLSVTNDRVFQGQLGHNIIFGKATRYGFPFRFGVKVQSVVEDALDSVIMHQDPLSVEYEFLKQRFHLSYNGSSLAQPKPVEQGFGSLVKSEVDTYISCPLSFSLIEVMKNQDRGFELVNFIKSISVDVKIQANDLVDNSLILDAEYSHKVDIKAKAYYKTIEDLMKSDVVNGYDIVSLMNVKQIAKHKVISPISFIYGAVPHNQIQINLSGEVSFPFMNPMSNFELKLTENSKSDFITEGQGNIYIKSNFIDMNGSVDLILKSVCDVKEGYIDYINNNIRALSSASMAKGGMSKGMFDFLQDVSANPTKYQLPNVDIQKLTFDIDASLKVDLKSTSNVINVEVRSFNFLVDDTGISLQNKTNLDSNFAWSASGVLSISNYDNIFDYVSKYIKQIAADSFPDDRVAIEKVVTSELLRYISNHPESKNTKMVFDYYGTASEGLNVGKYKFVDIVDLYNRYLYARVLELVKMDPKFVDEVPTVVPELSSNTEVMKRLREASSLKSATQ